MNFTGRADWAAFAVCTAMIVGFFAYQVAAL